MTALIKSIWIFEHFRLWKMKISGLARLLAQLSDFSWHSKFYKISKVVSKNAIIRNCLSVLFLYYPSSHRQYKVNCIYLTNYKCICINFIELCVYLRGKKLVTIEISAGCFLSILKIDLLWFFIPFSVQIICSWVSFVRTVVYVVVDVVMVLSFLLDSETLE